MAMTTGEVSIAAPAERVLGVIADVAAYPDWADGVFSASVLETGEDGRPLRARFEVRSGLVNGWYEVEYTWRADGVSWTLVSSPLLKEMDGGYWVRPRSEGCDVTYELSAVPTIPLLAALRRKAESQLVDVALQNLAARALEES